MSSLLLDRPLRSIVEVRQSRSGGRGLTLEERLQGAWEGLRADGAADCPVCRARMTLRDGAGECAGCGTTLS